MGGAGRCCLTGLALRGGEFGGGSAFIVGAGRGARALLDLSRSSRHVAYWREITGFLRHAHTRGGGTGARAARESVRAVRAHFDEPKKV